MSTTRMRAGLVLDDGRGAGAAAVAASMSAIAFCIFIRTTSTSTVISFDLVSQTKAAASVLSSKQRHSWYKSIRTPYSFLTFSKIDSASVRAQALGLALRLSQAFAQEVRYRVR